MRTFPAAVTVAVATAPLLGPTAATTYVIQRPRRVHIKRALEWTVFGTLEKRVYPSLYYVIVTIQ